MAQFIKNERHDSIKIGIDAIELFGDLVIPQGSDGIVLFAHGSGSSRLSPRNQFVAGELNKKRIATLLFDLLTQKEEEADRFTGHIRFNIALLANRLVKVTDWILKNPKTMKLKIGYFGSSTGAAAALMAAVERSTIVKTVVSRGGRPDLADSLGNVKCPVLLIVGGYDQEVIKLNKIAMSQIGSKKKLIIIPNATHLFEEQGKLEEVSHYACEWFAKYIGESKNI